MTEPLRLTTVIALALVIAGCPAPTGRRRGALDQDGGACAVASLPSTGDPCSSDGISCDFRVPCETSEASPTSSALERCACSGGRWRCSTLACEAYLPDGGLACPTPSSAQAQTFACDARLEGRTCTIAPVQCIDGVRPTAQCTCDGTYWRCPDAICERAPDGLPGFAGQACSDPSDCGGSLLCDRTLVRGGICTIECDPSAPSRVTAIVCAGAAAACAAIDNGNIALPGQCTSACAPDANQCRAGFVCSQLTPIMVRGLFACVPFCRRDDDCPEGSRCRVASGQCSTRSDSPTLLEDGAPCTEDLSQGFRCRGRCVRLSPDRGAPSVCASVSYRGDCPSTNGMPPVTRRVGDLTFCLGARCDARACCPSGTVCEYRSDLQATSCGADTPSPNLDCADSGVDSGVDAMAPPDAAPDASMDVSAD